jgi:uncharacterized membrane protein YfcA
LILGEWLALAVIALAVGFFIGAVGVGGILLIPALVWFGGVQVHQATATALFSFMFTGLTGTCLFQHRGSIDWPITFPVLGGALIFSYLGARANAWVNAQALTLMVALLVVYAGAYILLPAPRADAAYRDGSTRAQQLLLLVVGALAGFGSGLSGAGGPLFSVPMMLALGFAPLAAIGASQVLQIVAALSGTVGNLQFGSIDYTLAGWISLFELAGAVAGARAAHAFSQVKLRRMAGGLCLLTGLLLLARSL